MGQLVTKVLVSRESPLPPCQRGEMVSLYCQTFFFFKFYNFYCGEQP